MKKGVWNSATYRVIKAMRATGNQPGVIRQWVAGLRDWIATQPPTPEVLAIRAWLPLFQVRSVYTAAELAPLLPALASMMGFKELHFPRSPKRTENRLDFFGLPTLGNSDNGEGFVNPATGRYERYFIVEKIHTLMHCRMSQEEFERAFFRTA